ncbi:MAG: ribosome silencing factor [Flavobacteriales bacterium]
MAAAKKVTKSKTTKEKPKKEVAKKAPVKAAVKKAPAKTAAKTKPAAKAKKVDTSSASEKLMQLVVHGMQEVKGEDIVVLDLREIGNSSCDFFVICHGNSSTHCSAVAQGVEKEVKKATGEMPWRREGVSNGEWVLLDYVSVVVHVFQQYTRELYNIEDLWADAKTVKVK